MKKGSITIFLSLILCVILSLICTAMDSARYSCGRAMVSLAAEEGLFSLFGEYDRTMFERYGLLMIDGGYGNKDLKAGTLMEEVKKYMNASLLKEKDNAFSPLSDPFRITAETFAVTGYVLATDSDAEMIRQQIHELMIRKTAADSLGSTLASFTELAAVVEAADESDADRMDRLKAEYEDRKRQAAQERKKEMLDPSTSETPEKAEIPENFQNPIDNIYRLKRLGILAAAVPDGVQISAGSVDLRQLPSARTLAKGFGVLPQPDYSLADRFLLARYITDYFPCFTDRHDSGDFRYQAEYAIAEKSRDVDNLKSVLTRLLLIRETLNFTYLCSDPEKRAEAKSAALLLSSAILLPELAPLVETILLLCWAYGESMQDLKILLAGGKVPVIKDAGTFRLSLSELAGLGTDTPVNDSQRGLSYKDYLCILLMMKGGVKQMNAILDLLETNRRKEGEDPGFSIDTCVCAFEIQAEGRIANHSYLLTRSFGYDT